MIVILILGFVISAQMRMPQNSYEESFLIIEQLNRPKSDCSCYESQWPHTHFEFDDPRKCPKESMYMEKGLQSLPAWMLEKPNYGKLSEKCILFIMKSHFPKVRKSSMLVSCDSGIPQRGAFRPCLTSRLINFLTHAWVNVSQCLGAHPKLFLPIFMQESAFYPNALGASGDTGIGQITPTTRKYLSRLWGQYKDYIMTNSRASCQKSAQFIKDLQPARNQCDLMDVPQGVIRNFVYTMISLQENYQFIDSALESRAVKKNFRDIGGSDDDLERLKIQLVILAHNTGAGGAVNLFRAYLRYRINVGKPLKAKDFQVNFFSSKKELENQGYLSFANFVKTHQRYGDRRYLINLKAQEIKLKEAFPGRECTLINSFL